MPTDGKGFWIEPTEVSEIKPCTTAKFAWNEDFELPANVAGIIPAGDTFEIPITKEKKSVDWLVNSEAGTPIVFVVLTNGEHGTAGSLAPFKIGASTQNGCLDSSSPGTTGIPQPITTGGPTGSQSSSPSPSSTGDSEETGSENTSSGSNAGTIAGAAVGSAIGALLIAGLVLWCFLKRRKQPQDTHAVSIDLQETDESSPMRRNAANAAGYDADTRDPYLNPYPMGVPEPSFHRTSIATSSGMSAATGMTGSGMTGSGMTGSGSSSNLTEKQRLAQHEAMMASSSRYQQSVYAMSEEVDSEAVGPIAMPPPSYDHVLRVTNPSPRPSSGEGLSSPPAAAPRSP